MADNNSRFINLISNCISLTDENLNLCDNSQLKVILKNIHGLVDLSVQSQIIYRSDSMKNNVLLCFSQIKKILKLIYDLKQSSSECCKVLAINNYIRDRLSRCLKEILRCCTDYSDDGEEDNTGLFLKCMDIAIQLVPICNSSPHWGLVVDNLLCYALTIGKFSSDLNHKEILAGSQNVLRASERLVGLNVEEASNESLRKFYVNSLVTALEDLERRVNLSVLHLVFSIFAEPELYLKQLVQKCAIGNVTENSSIKNRSLKDIDDLISNLDFLNDSITQIGLFAMACTGHQRCILGIRCCLASFESLEEHLVPALSAFYLDPLNKSKRHFLEFLTNHWLEEVKVAEIMLDKIIDPAAFCQVAAEDLKSEYLTLKNDTNSKDRSTFEMHLKSFLNKGFKLNRHLKVGIDESITSKQPCICESMKNLNRGLAEIKKMMDLMKTEDPSNPSLNRANIFKRCAFVVTAARKLPHLLEIALNDSLAEDTKMKIERPKGADPFPESVRGLPLDITEASDDSEDFVEGFQKYLENRRACGEVADDAQKEELGKLLKQFQPRVEELSTVRNTLYQKTPRKSNVIQASIARTPLSIYSASTPCRPVAVRTKLFQDTPCNGPLPSFTEKTLNLEITGILENITQCCNTFNDTLDLTTEMTNIHNLPGQDEDNSDLTNISEILENITQWCDTFNQTQKSTSRKTNIHVLSNSERENSNPNSFNAAGISSLHKGLSFQRELSSESNNFNTLPRLQDIQLVEEKIRLLKSSQK